MPEFPDCTSKQMRHTAAGLAGIGQLGLFAVLFLWLPVPSKLTKQNDGRYFSFQGEIHLAILNQIKTPRNILQAAPAEIPANQFIQQWKAIQSEYSPLFLYPGQSLLVTLREFFKFLFLHQSGRTLWVIQLLNNHENRVKGNDPIPVSGHAISPGGNQTTVTSKNDF